MQNYPQKKKNNNERQKIEKLKILRFILGPLGGADP